ncbi:hypothetical protein BZA05DRAFT_431376 [Tricharina praecox]|uniref:uncharacterized protein n=1 Tax=Tricharina praecox TaxID=43433 RepID=UPI002220F08C|nr:uncharacterized protein BZA05DRAFT_431376 [Tricharina praecox]KAI5846125.1 hypothetical protein BZA05DRAFT_431376 [Tricharina praecox]
MATPNTHLQAWALPRLKALIDYLTDEDLLQAITYSASLPDAVQAADNFKSMLGETDETLTFISDFNSRAFPPSQPAAPTPTPAQGGRGGGRGRKRGGKAINHYKQEPRRANDGQEALFANPQGVYNKKDNDLEDEYYTGSRKATPTGSLKPTPTSSARPSPSSSSTNLVSTSSYAAVSKPPTQGKLTSDLVDKKPKPAPAAAKSKQEKYVYTTSGGTAMRGATAELTDLESALRALEMSTNPTLNNRTRKLCPCQGLTHEVLQAAPNCLACGKIICLKEGLGPCTFCGAPLLSPDEVQDMVRSLREEAGKEKMAINASQNKRAEVSKTPRPFSAAPEVGRADDESLRKAQEHRDRLLGFQATSAQRTRIIDQAADFETPLTAGGLNQWATPAERALQLKRQQKQMRLVQWSAKEKYEKQRVVVAIDLSGKKVVRQMQDIEPPSDSEEEVGQETEYDHSISRGGKGKEKAGSGGMYARNPLLKGLIKPVYEAKKGSKKEMHDALAARGTGWRRVQDDLADNERVILDGGVRGIQGDKGDEIPCG